MKVYQQPRITLLELSEQDVLTGSPIEEGIPFSMKREAFTDDSQGSFGQLFG